MMQRLPKRQPDSCRADPPTPIYLALIAVIGLLGLAVRVIDLDQIPPGLHFDQAANGLLALQVLTGQARPVFFSSYAGREALFMYLIAAVSAVIGPGIVALRLAGALAGAATIVAVAFLGAALYNRRAGILASAFLAGLYWHLHVSRLGERTILVPLLDTLALLALWHAFRRRSFGLAVLGGALAGLQLYTYPSSRCFILALVAIGFVELAGLTIRALSSRRLVLLGAVVVVAAVVATVPLALHFLHTPSDFLGRADEVAVWNVRAAGASPLTALASSTARTLGMFVWHGDADWKYNLANRPVFDPASATLFLLGLALAVWRWRDRANRLCLIWWGCLLVPGFLSVDAPQFMRTLGAAPAAVLFAARGLDLVVRLGQKRPAALIRRVALLLYGWPLLAGAFATYQYFAVWAPSPAAYLALEGDVTAAAQVIRAQSPRYAATYVASRYGADPTESFLDGDLFARLHWFDGRSALPLPPPGAGPTLYVLPRSATDSDWYQRLPAADRVADVLAPDHGPAVEAFVLTPDSLSPPSSASTPDLDVAGIARLTGAEVPPAVQAGLSIAPTLYWRIEQPPPEPVKFFVHLVDATGQTWAQYDEDVYPAAEWRPGQMLLVRRPLPIPADVPSGSYVLQAGIERANGQGLAATDQAGQSAGTFWQSPPVSVIRPQQPPALSTLGFGRAMNVLFGGAVRLVGVSIAPATVQDGDSVAVTLFWQVVRTPSSDLTTVIEAASPAGAIAARSSQSTTGGVWPARDWKPGDIVVDRQRVLIPAGTASGPVTLTVGLHDAANQPLRPSGAASPLIAIGNLSITARPRPATTVVTISHPLDVSFQNGIRLLGYDVDPVSARPGQPIHLTLYWQAEKPVLQGWTVFTHLLDLHDQVRAQNDAIPDNGQRPTTTWAPGETIVDPHTLVLQPATQPGFDRLEIGLYDSGNGQRLKTTAGDDRVLLDVPVDVLGGGG